MGFKALLGHWPSSIIQHLTRWGGCLLISTDQRPPLEMRKEKKGGHIFIRRKRQNPEQAFLKASSAIGTLGPSFPLPSPYLSLQNFQIRPQDNWTLLPLSQAFSPFLGSEDDGNFLESKDSFCSNAEPGGKLKWVLEAHTGF